MKKIGILLLTIFSLFLFLLNGNSNSRKIKEVVAETAAPEEAKEETKEEKEDADS